MVHKGLSRRDGAQPTVKRVFDLVLAMIIVLPAGAACLALAPLVWLDTKAHPLFIQTRVGQNGKLFRIVKLRTMRADTTDAASHETPASQITKLGAILRKLKLDEIPQLWNVLAGHMSFVGPRPCLPSQQDLIAERECRGVLRLKPGITGPSQVRGIDMSQPRRLAESDADYLGKWSIRKDVYFLYATSLGSGRGDAVVGQ